MILYDYICNDCDAEFEELVSSEEREFTLCQVCGGTAEQIMSTVNFDPKMGFDPDFPTAYDRWAKNRHEKYLQEVKHSG